MFNDSDIKKVFMENLSRLLSKNNIAQIELANYMRVSNTTINNWVKGYKMPRMDKIDKICMFFRITRSELIESNSLVHQTKNNSNITEKVKKLSVDKQKKVEKIVDDLSGSETIAAHRTDDPTKDLPEDARKSIEDFKKFIFEKHGIKYD